MDQYCTGWCRFRTIIRYRHMAVTSVFVFLVRFIEHVIHTYDSMSYTHMIDMRCIQSNDKMITLLKPDCTVAKKEHHKDDYIVYCVRNDISKWTKIIYVGGPELIMLGPQDTRLGPWLVMSGRRLLMSGPKLLHWEYGRGPEINMSGPRLIMSGPLPVMPGPRQLCRVPDLLCLSLYLCLSPEIIM